MRVDVFTIFPEYLDAPMSVSLLGRARASGVLAVRANCSQRPSPMTRLAR